MTTRFKSLLKKIDSRLELPQPEKSKILLEIAADLEDLFDFYISQGLNEAEAMKKAEADLNFSDESIEELKKIHQTAISKFFNRIAAHKQNMIERIVLFAISLLVFILSITTVSTSSFIRESSVLVWPVLGIVFIAFIFSLIKFYTLYIKRDYPVKRLRNSLDPLIFLGCAGIFTGIAGYFFELFKSGLSGILLESRMMYIIAFSYYDIESPDIRGIILKTTSIQMATLAAVFIIGFMWYVLYTKAAEIEMAEASAILDQT